MKIKAIVRLTSTVMLASLLGACGLMPSVDDVFIDQRDEYKKAHELPSLEVPPGLSGGTIKDEYDGGAKKRIEMPTDTAVVETTPLSDLQPSAELIQNGVDSYLLVRDSLRNAWRKTISALDEKGYDIEDKNRQSNQVYLNIAKDDGSSSMLSSLSFWKKADTEVYVLELKRAEGGIAIRVLDEEKVRIDNLASKTLLTDLLDQFAP
ncbi:MAG: outer membrane protein assembly factor BamC [Cycloclasticus sp.]|jgi:uncharacterized lipoprotein|nr:outer membrane protein assembly factor BamC [Cycloclasticus sp.]MDF1689130.1 outer membrane protein assembly factor BamC [Cycloclasticus sp.]MEE4291983.1 hypothetical protein [Cycloclasticus sp.]